jgi:GH24 family phage-related lysozyme (muramidase)
MAEMANKLQLYNTMRQEKERGFAESNALRDWIKNGGDVTTPEGQREAVALAPNAGPGFIKSNLDIIGQDRINKQAALGLTETQGRINAQGPALETAKAEAAAKTLAFHRDTAPMVKDQATYDIWRANVAKDSKELGARIDPIYTAENMQRYMMTANQSLEQLKQATEGTIKEIDLPGGRKGFVRITSKGVETLPQIGTPGAATPTQPFASPAAAAPAVVARQPIAATGAAAPAAAAPASAPADLASNLLRRFEGFRETPYYDVNAYRTGYGSDTITQADGKVIKVQPGMQITKEDAERDLSRRLNTEFIPRATGQVGAENWTALPAPAQAALASVAYNYGSLPSSVVAAVKTGDANAIADAVQALKDNPGRRAQEAAVIRGNGLIQSSATVPSMTMGQQFAVPGSVPGGLNALAPITGVPAGGFNNLARPSALSLNPSIAGGSPAAAMAPAAAAAPAPAVKPPVLAEISPAEAEKRDAAQATAIRQYTAAQQALDEQIKNVQELKTHKGLSSITGTVAGHPYMPNFTQDAANAQELLTSITEKGKLEELLNLKAMGGSLGQVAVSEGEGLKKAHGVLGQRQDTETFRGRVGQLESKLTAAKSALKDAFEQQYAYRGIPAPDVPAMPTVKMPKSAEPAETAETGVVRNERGRRGTLNAKPLSGNIDFGSLP